MKANEITEPGYYWCRYIWPDGEWTVVYVRDRDFVDRPAPFTVFTIGNETWDSLDDRPVRDAEFFGPISPPDASDDKL